MHHDMGERVFPCVKLRGLPFDANEDEIRVFLVSAASPCSWLMLCMSVASARIVLSCVRIQLAAAKARPLSLVQIADLFPSQKSMIRMLC